MQTAEPPTTRRTTCDTGLAEPACRWVDGANERYVLPSCARMALDHGGNVGALDFGGLNMAFPGAQRASCRLLDTRVVSRGGRLFRVSIHRAESRLSQRAGVRSGAPLRTCCATNRHIRIDWSPPAPRAVIADGSLGCTMPLQLSFHCIPITGARIAAPRCVGARSHFCGMGRADRYSDRLPMYVLVRRPKFWS